MVRYKVKPERVAENEALVRAVYDELSQSKPSGLRYATFRLDDGVSFVHIASTTAEQSALAEIEAFGRFTENIRERCDEEPVATAINEVGSFSWPAG
jgi:hypothetical protein